MFLSANWIVGPLSNISWGGLVPPVSEGFAKISASLQQTSTLSLGDVMTQTTSSLTGFVPDLGVFIAAGAVLGLTVMGARRLIKAGR